MDTELYRRIDRHEIRKQSGDIVCSLIVEVGEHPPIRNHRQHGYFTLDLLFQMTDTDSFGNHTFSIKEQGCFADEITAVAAYGSAVQTLLQKLNSMVSVIAKCRASIQLKIPQQNTDSVLGE